MTLQMIECPNSELLRDIVWGRIPPERFDLTLQHIDSCHHCTAEIERLSDADGPRGGPGGDWRVIFNPPQLDLQLQNELECQAGVQKMLMQSSVHQPDPSRLPLDQIGPYRLVRPLGSGGMGAVYLAEHTKLKRPAAIKILPRERARDVDWVQRFSREMQAVAALEHPNVVRALDAGEQDQWHYLAMEFLDGLDLTQLMQRSASGSTGPLSIGAICQIGNQAAAGLSAISDIGMVHRDIKPSNIFVTKLGVVKILDLGLVLAGTDPLAYDDRLTTVGHLIGTLAYMSPEQVQDCRVVDNRSDLYSLGATLYRLLTGVPPHGPTRQVTETIRAICEQTVAPIASHRSDLPTELASTIDSMLDRDPAKRPVDARAVQLILAKFADEKSLSTAIKIALATPDGSQAIPPGNLPVLRNLNEAKSQPPRRPNRWWLVAAAMLPLFGFAAGILITIATDQGELTIRSDTPGVNVEVLQGQTAVREMTLETSEKQIVLHSGTYAIRIIGSEADGFKLSENRVTLTRGAEVVVTISKNDPQADSSTAMNDRTHQPGTPIFNGKTYDQWMKLIYSELDPETIAQAIQAIELLSTDDQKQFAATACLYPLRTYGSFVVGVDANSDTVQNAIKTYFPRFPMQVRLRAMSNELFNGNVKSGMANWWLWETFPHRWTTGNLPGLPRPIVQDYDRACKHWLLVNPASNEKEVDSQNPKATGMLKGAREYLFQQRAQIAAILETSLDDEDELIDYVQSTFNRERDKYRERQLAMTSKSEQVSNAGSEGFGGGMGGAPLCQPIDDVLVELRMRLPDLRPEDIEACIDAMLWNRHYEQQRAISSNRMYRAFRQLHDQDPSLFFRNILQSCLFRQDRFNENGVDNDVVDEYMSDRAVDLIFENPDRIVALKTLALLANRATNKKSIINFKYLLEKVFSGSDPRQQCVAIEVLSKCGNKEAEPYISTMLQSSDRWYPMAVSLDRAKSSEASQSELSDVARNSQNAFFYGGGIVPTGQPLMDIWKTVDVDQEVAKTTLDRACFLLLRSDPGPSTSSVERDKMGCFSLLRHYLVPNWGATLEPTLIDDPAIERFAAHFFLAVQDSTSIKQIYPTHDAKVDDWVEAWKGELKKEQKTTQWITREFRKTADVIGATTDDGVVLVQAADFLESLFTNEN